MTCILGYNEVRSKADLSELPPFTSLIRLDLETSRHGTSDCIGPYCVEFCLRGRFELLGNMDSENSACLGYKVSLKCTALLKYYFMYRVRAPVAGHSYNPVWTDKRSSVIWSDADLLAAGSSVRHHHLQVQDPPGSGSGQFPTSRLKLLC